MSLIIAFLAFFGIGEAAVFLVGLGAEYELGKSVSLFIFLGGLVVAVVVAWRLAVRWTEPKPGAA